MISKPFIVKLEKNPVVSIEVTPGHFSTGYYHTNFYINVSRLKSNVLAAQDVARELVIPYKSSIMVDTIVCLEKTRVLGAFLGRELLTHGTGIMNDDGDIHVLTPMYDHEKNTCIFYDNEIDWIANKNVIVLTTTVSSGRSLYGVLKCLKRDLGANIRGISALFVYSDSVRDENINSLFTTEDIPGYNVYNAEGCALCKADQKVDALICSEGYKKI
jgi:orotate phosphoribosyltransferase